MVIWEIVLQTLVAFFSILFLTRIIGKQQMAQLTFYDYVNGITFGSIAANMATNLSQRTWHHLIGLILFAMLTWLMAYISLKNRSARKVLNGEPSIVIHEGKILENNLRRFRINMDEVLSLLRQKGVFYISDVAYAILETNGQLSVLLKGEKQIPSRETFGFPPTYSSIPIPLILDGILLTERIVRAGLTVETLRIHLKKVGVTNEKDVIYAAYEKETYIYIDTKEDKFFIKAQIGDIINNK